MKRMLLACLSCAALGAVALAPASASAGGYTPPAHKQSIVGAGFLSPFDPGEFVNFFAIDLIADADGSNPRGAATVIGYTGSGADRQLHAFAGTPVCMKVDSNGAATFVLKFFVTKGIGDIIAGARFWVQDNGRPSSLNHPVDQIIDDRYSATQLAKANCDSTTPPRPQKTIAKGDTVVKS